MSKNGLVLFQTPDVVVIATGFASGSANSKTADMIQIWLLNRHMNPVAARKVGADDTVCFDCPHRNGTCYVNLGRLRWLSGSVGIGEDTNTGLATPLYSRGVRSGSEPTAIR